MARIKTKGAYDADKEWHQDASALVIPKVAQKVLIEGAPIRETVESWPDIFDFFHRIKVPRGSSLVCSYNGEVYSLPSTTRYYVAKGGVVMTKIMPPLAGKTEHRRIGVESGWTVCPCNNVKDARLPVDFDYYVEQVERLVLKIN